MFLGADESAQKHEDSLASCDRLLTPLEEANVDYGLIAAMYRLDIEWTSGEPALSDADFLEVVHDPDSSASDWDEARRVFGIAAQSLNHGILDVIESYSNAGCEDTVAIWRPWLYPRHYDFPLKGPQ